jgi:hypothetical protein
VSDAPIGAARKDSAAEETPLVALLAQLHGAMHNLWTIFVVATFAAAGFGAQASLSWPVAAAVTAGFWLFALGHLRLLRQTLALIAALQKDLAALPPAALTKTREQLAGIGNRFEIARAIHLGIDLCVTAAIWLPLALR